MGRIQAVLPIPLHPLKQWINGWSAPSFLAKKVAQLLHKPLIKRGLRRTRWTRSQTHLGLTARNRNVQKAFKACSPTAGVSSVLLIDDVLTSGATAHACSNALQLAGVKEVFVLTGARTLKPDTFQP